GAARAHPARERQRGGAREARHAGARPLSPRALGERGERASDAGDHARGQEPGPGSLAARLHGDSKMRLRKSLLAGVIACLSFAVAVPNGYAQWAVIDVANLIQSVQQYLQMVEQLAQLKSQLEQLRNQYDAITGSYGVGGLGQAEALGAQAIVPGSWQEVVKLQQEGKYETKMTFYEGLMKAVDPALFAKDKSRNAGAYKLSYDNTRAAFAVTDATYDAVE